SRSFRQSPRWALWALRRVHPGFFVPGCRGSSCPPGRWRGQRCRAPPPRATQIFTAKNVFISTGGLDGIALQTFRKLGDVDQPYNAFYAAMKEWGKYTLVFSPAEADLVLEIRFKAPFNGDKHVPSYAPQCNLTIYDAKTRFVLGTNLEPCEG